MKKTSLRLPKLYCFALKGILIAVFAMASVTFASAQSEIEAELAVNQLIQLIEDHQSEFEDVLKHREPAAYQLNPEAVVKSVFLHRMKIEVVERESIDAALDATETYCVEEKQFPANIVADARTEVEQALE